MSVTLVSGTGLFLSVLTTTLMGLLVRPPPIRDHHASEVSHSSLFQSTSARRCLAGSSGATLPAGINA